MAGLTIVESMRALGDATREAAATFEKFKTIMTNAQIEEHFEYIAATHDFMLDGGDVWGIEVVETAFLGEPLDVIEILKENGLL